MRKRETWERLKSSYVRTRWVKEGGLEEKRGERRIEWGEHGHKEDLPKWEDVTREAACSEWWVDLVMKRKAKENKTQKLKTVMKVELNLYLSSDVIPFIILNCLNYSCIYVFLMAYQISYGHPCLNARTTLFIYFKLYKAFWSFMYALHMRDFIWHIYCISIWNCVSNKKLSNFKFIICL